MPQRGETDPDGWIHSDQLCLKPQTLPAEDSQPFLENLLTDIAQRPAKMRLRETAGVVRFLRRLASQGIPGDVPKSEPEAASRHQSKESLEDRKARNRLDELALVIWKVLVQTGDLPTADAETTIQLLERHRSTYLEHYDVEEAIELINTLHLPQDAEDLFEPPHLISRTTTSAGEGNPHLGSDLTEKIYIAYSFLKRYNVESALTQLADTMNHLEVKHERTTSRWTYADVNDKVKHYRKGLRERLRQPTQEATELEVTQRTDDLIDLQIMNFLGQRDVAKRNEERQQAIDKKAKEANAGIP